MKRFLFTLLTVFALFTPAFSASEQAGRQIVEKLINSNRAEIVVFGAATQDSRLSLILKKASDWKILDKDKKESVCLYIKSMIPDVKNSPQKYLKMSSSAPFYPRAMQNSRNMCLDCWEVSSEQDSFVVGDEAWERMEYKEGNKNFSSVFKKQKQTSVDTRSTVKINDEDMLEKRVNIVSEKIKSESYYGDYLAGIRVSDENITIYAKQSWSSMKSTHRDEVIKKVYTLWLNTGKISGIEEDQDKYKIEVRSSLYGGVLATWDKDNGFLVR